MKYLSGFKLFEMVSYEFYLEDSWVKKGEDKPRSVDYKFTDGENNFLVQFTYTEGNGFYIRNYFRVNTNKPYSLVNGNPYRILGTVTEITIDFLKKFKPELLKIYHIYESGEDKREHPKRALSNKRILERELPERCPEYHYKLIRGGGESTSVIRRVSD
jgi:hypothetical protein